MPPEQMSQAQPTQMPPVEAPKKKGSLALVIIIILLLVGFLYYRSKNMPIQQEVTNTEQAVVGGDSNTVPADAVSSLSEVDSDINISDFNDLDSGL